MNLPPLPRPAFTLDSGTLPCYTDDQLRDYATAAVKAERAKIYDLVQDIFVGLSIDHEQGVAWLNEAVSAQWMREHPTTNTALQNLAEYVKDWGPE